MTTKQAEHAARWAALLIESAGELGQDHVLGVPEAIGLCSGSRTRMTRTSRT